jgi:hypothetical protein
MARIVVVNRWEKLRIWENFSAKEFGTKTSLKIFPRASYKPFSISGLENNLQVLL